MNQGIFYTYDFEFQEDGDTIDPISVGICSSADDRELYLTNSSFNWSTASDWLMQNVSPGLYSHFSKSGDNVSLPKDQMGQCIYDWLRQDNCSKWKMVGYYSEYDHVCLSQRYGKMINLPEGIPVWSRNIKQWADDLGDPQLPIQEDGEHNALADARWNMTTLRWLMDNYAHPAWSQYR